MKVLPQHFGTFGHNNFNPSSQVFNHFRTRNPFMGTFANSETQMKRAVTCDFQQCGVLTSVDSDEPVQPSLKLRNSKCVQSVA